MMAASQVLPEVQDRGSRLARGQRAATVQLHGEFGRGAGCLYYLERKSSRRDRRWTDVVNGFVNETRHKADGAGAVRTASGGGHHHGSITSVTVQDRAAHPAAVPSTHGVVVVTQHPGRVPVTPTGAAPCAGRRDSVDPR